MILQLMFTALVSKVEKELSFLNREVAKDAKNDFKM